MAELNQEGYGNQQYINFGKYKSKTFYDVANLKDFKYLKWCINMSKLNKNKPGEFKLNPTCIQHCGAALLTENTPGEWMFQKEQKEQNARAEYLTPEGLCGPRMTYSNCTRCGESRNTETMKNNICYKCNKI